MSEFGADTAAGSGPPGADFSPVFSWKNPGGRRFRLGMFLAAALTLHAFLFYLFQVVYPPSRRLVHQPAGITILSAADPTAASLLNKVAERTPAFEGGIGESAALLAARENFVADYVATYHGYQPRLRKPRSTILPKPLPLLATPGAITLPAIERPARPPAPAQAIPPIRAVATLRVEDRAGDDATERAWTLDSPPALLPDSLARGLAALPSPPRLRVGVDASGRVIFTGTIDLLAPDLEKPLRAAASRLRFKPVDTNRDDADPDSAGREASCLVPSTFVPLVVTWLQPVKESD